MERKSNEGGAVSRNKAKNELEQLKAEDPLPLRRAKLNQEAAVRKCEKARKQAEASRAAQEEAQRQVEAAVRESEKRRDEALAYLEKVKASGAGAGQVTTSCCQTTKNKKQKTKNKKTKKTKNKPRNHTKVPFLLLLSSLGTRYVVMFVVTSFTSCHKPSSKI